MNSVQLVHKLFEMASGQNKYAMNWCTAIINAIMVQYMTKSDYMEENAIKTFSGFLETGVLNWDI